MHKLVLVDYDRDLFSVVKVCRYKVQVQLIVLVPNCQSIVIIVSIYIKTVEYFIKVVSSRPPSNMPA